MTEGASFVLVLTAAIGIAWWGVPADQDAITKLVCHPAELPWNQPDCHVPITPPERRRQLRVIDGGKK